MDTPTLNKPWFCNELDLWDSVSHRSRVTSILTAIPKGVVIDAFARNVYQVQEKQPVFHHLKYAFMVTFYSA